jgi:DNA-binding transcriptional regulator YdaS (Cro superfamily)
MDLKTYNSKERGRATALATKLGVSVSYLSQMAAGTAPISAARAMEIEKATDGLVTRQELYEDWQRVWPDLLTQHKRRVTDRETPP